MCVCCFFFFFSISQRNYFHIGSVGWVRISYEISLLDSLKLWILTMVERKLYKTKLCVLYERGHCPRQTCSFAHGDAELRGFSGSFNGNLALYSNSLFFLFPIPRIIFWSSSRFEHGKDENDGKQCLVG